jgi:hypothetical protein
LAPLHHISLYQLPLQFLSQLSSSSDLKQKSSTKFWWIINISTFMLYK